MKKSNIEIADMKINHMGIANMKINVGVEMF